jgi:hypothetical protein
MQFDLNYIINQQLTNMFASVTVITDTPIIAIIITLTFIVSVSDHEILTAVHFIRNSINFKTLLHNFHKK